LVKDPIMTILIVMIGIGDADRAATYHVAT
jgi:hypothetical protein